jgi:hypothetical protein
VVGERFEDVVRPLFLKQCQMFKRNNLHDTIDDDKNPCMFLLSTPCIINTDNVFDERRMDWKLILEWSNFNTKGDVS